MKVRLSASWAICAITVLIATRIMGAAPLATLEYKIVGTQLRVDPPSFSVPKGVPGSINVDVVSGDGAKNALTVAGAHIEATLRGPSFPARRLVTRANEPLLLPPLHLVGDYQIDDIKLVDSTTGKVRLEGTPQSVAVRVFDEVLVSRVTSRPLSLDEIREKGIVIDEKNFRVVEFEVVFVLRGSKFPVRLPVVSPSMLSGISMNFATSQWRIRSATLRRGGSSSFDHQFRGGNASVLLPIPL